MADLVVTVPKWFWPEWIDEGDAAGEPWSGQEWGFFLGGRKPDIQAGDRLYIVAHGRLRGFAPCTRLAREPHVGGKWVICREGGGEAVTIAQAIPGFRGWRRRWWSRADEYPFPDWKTEGVGS